MRYFIHIVTDKARIVDPDGAVFSSLEAARVEASQSARDLMSCELMAGRTVPLRWRVQIADEATTIVATIPFATLVFGTGGPYSEGSGAYFVPVTDLDVIERTKATLLKSQKSKIEIREALERLWAQVRTLAKMNAALGGEGAPADL